MHAKVTIYFYHRRNQSVSCVTMFALSLPGVLSEIYSSHIAHQQLLKLSFVTIVVSTLNLSVNYNQRKYIQTRSETRYCCQRNANLHAH